MAITVGTIVAAMVAVEIACAAVQWFRDLWGTKVNAPASLCTAEMSTTDQEMQEETKHILKEVFGENIAESIQSLDAAQRIVKAEEFIEKLKDAYGLDVEVEFYGENRSHCGFYNSKLNTLNLNVADLLSKNMDCSYEFINTIIHELRHAVQWKAIQEDGFWNTDKATRINWMNNFANYIQYGIDPKGYAQQPVEVDAVTFVDGCLKGVFN